MIGSIPPDLASFGEGPLPVGSGPSHNLEIMALRQCLVSVYVDGFNLYCGLFSGAGCCPPDGKWMNIVRLAELICESRDVDATISAVRYCTAKALPTENDSGQPMRQLRLLTALETLQEVQLIYGQHKERPTRVKLYGPNRKVQMPTVLVSKREEKGSDVNLAAFLVRDAALDVFDIALVITDDSDLHQAVRLAVDDFDKEVWVASPFFRRSADTKDLSQTASAYFRIDPAMVAQSQFPDDIVNWEGKIVVSRPYEWRG